MDIQTPAQLKTLIAEHGRTALKNWALRKGGAIDIVLLGNGSHVAVHPEPKKLTKDELAEIDAIIAAEQDRRKAQAARESELAATAAAKAARAAGKSKSRSAPGAPSAEPTTNSN